MIYEEAIAIEHEITRMLVANVKEEHKDRMFTAHKMAIELLEKQIPKKPIARKHDELRGHILFHCPTCDDDFNCNEYEETYCAECGQKLNWRGEE